MKFTMICLMLLTLTSCAWLWPGDTCEGEDCDIPQLLDDKPLDKNWVCYGDENQQWQCEGHAKDQQSGQ